MIKSLNDPEKLEQKIRILSRRIEAIETENIKEQVKIKTLKYKNADLREENSILKKELFNLRNGISEYHNINSKTAQMLNKYTDFKNKYHNIVKEFRKELKPTVYAYVDENNIIVYIGSTQNIHERDKGHIYSGNTYFDKNYNSKSQYNLIILAETNTIEDARIMEEIMILKYKPRFNIVTTPRLINNLISNH